MRRVGCRVPQSRFLGLSPPARAPSVASRSRSRSRSSIPNGVPHVRVWQVRVCHRRQVRGALCCAPLSAATRAPRAVCALRTSLRAVAVAVAVARARSMRKFGFDATSSSLSSLRVASPRVLASPRCDSAARAATAPAATPHARCAPCMRRRRRDFPRRQGHAAAYLRCTPPRQDCGGSATGKTGACSCTPGACKCAGGCLCAKCKTAAQ